MKNVDELKQILDNLEIQIQKCKLILEGGSLTPSKSSKSDLTNKLADLKQPVEKEKEKVIEGVFDGQKMIGPDGKQYSIPANYISKSKLVEGDILKLTIDDNGNFIYKQIGPVDRERLLGKLVKDEATTEFVVMANGKTYKVIMASVTYFKGEEGDEVVFLIPKGSDSQWAAIENIIKK